MLKLGVIGYPLKHTLSPVMQNAALQKTGIEGCYLAFEIDPDKLKEAFDGFKVLSFRGYNVTIPYKIQIMEFLDAISDEARAIGAVNTVIIDESGNTRGDNTDYYGFLNTFSENDRQHLKGKKAVVIGSGGASRAVGAALANMQLAEIMFYDKIFETAKNTARHISELARNQVVVSAGALDDIVLQDVSLVVNATPAGMYPHVDATPIEPDHLDHLNPGAILFDLIYRPDETLFIKEAAKRGIKTYCGSEMLVLQGAKAFELWTGQPAPVDLMRQKLLESIQNG